jgi:biopolymer transport protein ExbB/TolQ
MIVDRLLKVALLGSSWVLWLLLALSVVSLVAILERVAFFRRRRNGASLRAQLSAAARVGDWAAIERALAEDSSVEAEVLRAALPWRDGGAQSLSDAIDSELGRVRQELDRGANLLGTLGNNAPFIGLFGTVIGVIEAFQHLGSSAARAGNMGNVMSGIAEALIATAVGIFVAIPAVVAFNVANKRAGEVEGNTLALARLLTARLHSEAHAATHERRARDSSPGHAPLGAQGGFDGPELSLSVGA